MNFVIHNKIFSQTVRSSQTKGVLGSLICFTNYVPGTTMDIQFMLTVSSSDLEYVDSVALVFPAGFKINSGSDYIDQDGVNPINDKIISWGDNDNVYGGIAAPYDPENYLFYVNVTIDDTVTGDKTIKYFVSGDETGTTPHFLAGTCISKSPVKCAANQVKINIELHTDKYGNETTWELNGLNGVPKYAAGGPYKVISNGYLITEDVCVPEGGDLEFVIKDSYYDGICCVNGDGYYKVSSACGIIKEGGQFNYVDEVRFSAPNSKLMQKNFEKVYGGLAEDIGRSVLQTCDGGYIACGQTQSFGANLRDIYVVRTNYIGDTLWTKSYGTKNNDYGYSIIETYDNNYIIIGSTGPTDHSWSKLYVLKIDQSGDTLWTTSYGNTWDKDFAYSIVQTPDSGIVVAGNSNKNGNEDIYLVKFNSSGQYVWDNLIGKSNKENSRSIISTSDGGFVITGFTVVSDYVNYAFITKTDADGKELWTKNFYGEYTGEFGYSVIETKDKGFVISGTTTVIDPKYDFYMYKACLIKTNADGDSIWRKTFWSPYDGSEAYAVKQTNDGNFILTGYSGVYDTAQRVYSTIHGMLIKTDENGDTLWSTYFKGKTGLTYLQNVIPTADGGYAAVGFTQAGRTYDIYLIKTKADGTTEQINNNQTICLVTVDESTGKNMIVWDKTPHDGTASYNIYKESNYSGQYLLIGNVKVDSASIFIDKASNPLVKSDRYKISCVNANKYESKLSPFHKTMHLNVNKGQGNIYNLIWDQYEGFDFGTYFIFRGTKPDKITQIADIQNNLTSYTDYTAPSGVTVYYAVIVAKKDTCLISKTKANSGKYYRSVSNIDDNGIVAPINNDATLKDIQVNQITIAGFSPDKTLYYLYLPQGTSDFPQITATPNDTNAHVEIINATTIPGLTSVLVTATDGETKKIYAVNLAFIQGIEDFEKDNLISIFPNPATDLLTIQLDNQTQSYSLEIQNTIGQMVYSKKLINPIEQVDLSAQPAGVYFLKLQSADNTIVKKIMKQE